MKHRVGIHRVMFWGVVRSAIRVSERVREARPLALLVMECPANSVPGGMRQTGMEGAWDGEGKEAQSGADRELDCPVICSKVSVSVARFEI
jgi:hypothetical protein